MKSPLALLMSLLVCGTVFAQTDTQPVAKAGPVVQVPVPAPGGPAPKIACAKPTFDFGEVSQGDEVRHGYEVENTGKAELDIINVHGSCGCTHAGAEKTKLAPGEKTIVNGTLNTTGKFGPTTINITVTTNDPVTPTLNLSLTGRVAQPFRTSITEVNFGTVQKGTPIPDKTFDVITSGAQAITEIKTDNEQVKASYERIPEAEKVPGYRVTVKVEGVLPVGQLRSLVSIGTTVASQKTLTVPVLAVVEGEVTVKPRTFNFGKVKRGEPTTKTVEIEKAGNADLKIENVSVKPEGTFTAKVEEVKGGKAYKIVLGVAPDAKDGYSRGTVSIKTNVPGETDLQVYFYALLQN
jgi:hypothetical protein